MARFDGTRRRAAAGAFALGAAAAIGAPALVRAQSREPIRLAVVEGLSGPFANAGESVVRNLQFAVDRVNARGGVLVGGVRRAFELSRHDSKGQAEEALVMLREVTDRRSPFVLQGNSSAIAAAILDAVNKHNERQPENRLLFLNYSAVDPILTNERCSFWHFRFDAHLEMRMTALAEALAANRRVQRVYLLNQDYSFGQQFARLARAGIAQRRPDVVVAGDELHPLGRVKDFAPYATKIRAAGADTVVTGNWGNDLTFLVRAAREIGLDASFFTFYGNGLGAPAAIGEAGVDRVRAVAEWHPNVANDAAERIYRDFRARLRDPRDDYFNMRHVVMLEMLAASIEAAGSTEAARVAAAMAGRAMAAGPLVPYAVQMRRADHQLLTPQVVSVMQRAGGDTGLRYDLEASGFGFRTEREFSAADTAPASRCEMARPA